MRKQNRRNRWLLAGFVGVVIAAGLLSRSTYSLPNWFREYGGDTLWSMMMYGIFALLFPHARAKTLFIATLLFSYLIECSQLWTMTGSIHCVRHRCAIYWDRALYGVIWYATA